MSLTKNEIIEAANSSILGLIGEFQKTPYRFLYESDIQAIIFASIRKSIGEDSIQIKGTGHPHDQYEVSVVHTEYWKRIDIVCLDVEEILKNPPEWLHLGMDLHVYQLPILVGIEIKYRKLGDRLVLKVV